MLKYHAGAVWVVTSFVFLWSYLKKVWCSMQTFHNRFEARWLGSLKPMVLSNCSYLALGVGGVGGGEGGGAGGRGRGRGGRGGGGGKVKRQKKGSDGSRWGVSGWIVAKLILSVLLFFFVCLFVDRIQRWIIYNSTSCCRVGLIFSLSPTRRLATGAHSRHEMFSRVNPRWRFPINRLLAK